MIVRVHIFYYMCINTFSFTYLIYLRKHEMSPKDTFIQINAMTQEDLSILKKIGVCLYYKKPETVL